MKCAALKNINIQHFPTNFMISSCFFAFKCCILLFIEGLKMSFYHILVCDAVFVTFVKEKKKGTTNCWNLWMQRLRKFPSLPTRFFCLWFYLWWRIWNVLSLLRWRGCKEISKYINPFFFLEKKGLSYKNFLNYWLFISSAFYVWEFLRKAVYWGKFMS